MIKRFSKSYPNITIKRNTDLNAVRPVNETAPFNIKEYYSHGDIHEST